MPLVTFDHRRNGPRRRSTFVAGLIENTGAQIGRLAGLRSAHIRDPLPGCNIWVIDPIGDRLAQVRMSHLAWNLGDGPERLVYAAASWLAL